MWIVVILALIVNLLSLSQGMSKEIFFELVENCSIGTVVGNIKHSADLDLFKNVELRLENSEYFEDANSISQNRYGKSAKNLFQINNITGDLITISEIDREILCQFNTKSRNENCTILQIVSINKLRWININILIIDINDNAPTFRLKNITLFMSEISKLHTAISLEESVDLDSDKFRPIRYSIHSKSVPFNLSQNPLKLILTRPLDYEMVKSYLIIIVACDNGKPILCGSQTITINITNENDESPTFLRSNYTAIINEDIPVGQIVMWLTAVDKDHGDYGKLEYSFSDGFEEVKKHFSIDKKTGQITIIKKLTQPTKFKFSIEAKDQAPNPMYGLTWVILHVVDVNNNSPVILVSSKESLLISRSQNHTVIEIPENHRTPHHLAYLTVSDLDRGENARCSCKIQSASSKMFLKYFKLVNVNEMSERSIFKLLVEKSFDAEETEYFSIIILCQDHGEPPNYMQTKLEIHIKDENEYAPTFDQEIYEIYIKENSLPETIVQKVKVYDRDLTHSSIFGLTLPGSIYFNINSSGILSTKSSFDYEKQTKLSFHILAINRGIKSFTSSAKVTVLIIDVNDNTPEFSLAVTKFEIPENLKGYYEIGKIEALDKDSGENSRLNYYLLNVTSENCEKPIFLEMFDLNHATGVIYSNVSLDYEKCELYVITVKIADNGKPSLTNIQNFYIHVVDVNDNGPVWQYPNIHDNTMNISVQNVRDMFLTRVRAVDIDSDKYNVVHYHLLNNNDIFSINKLTGEIFFKNLNIKSGQKVLQLQAVDAYSRTIQSSQIFTVYIMDDERFFLQISISPSLKFPVMICIIGISSLISIILVIFVFYFCYRKRCMYRNYNQSSISNDGRIEDKFSESKFHKESKSKNNIPLDLVTDNDPFNQNMIEDSMKLMLDPLYNSTTSTSIGINQSDKNPQIQSLFCKLAAENSYKDIGREGYLQEFYDPKQTRLVNQTIANLQTQVNQPNEVCVLHSLCEKDKTFRVESQCSKHQGFECNDSMLDSYATFLNCSCSNNSSADFENVSPSNKVVTAPFIFNGSAWIPNTLIKENLLISRKKSTSRSQPLKSIMKKTPASFLNIDSSSSSGQCNDTDQVSSSHDSSSNAGYYDSSCLSPKSISLLDNTYQCKKSQV